MFFEGGKLMIAAKLSEETTVIGVGIDTARYGHRVTFLRGDAQPAAAPLDLIESRDGYERLQAELERLARRHPGATFRVRIDAAGQYATNLESFLRGLALPLEISLGEPARNAAYRRAHFPKRKSDASDSLANARYAVAEAPVASPATAPQFLALREVVSRLESQTKRTTRLVNQLHNLLSRVFPELATLVSDLKVAWVRELLSRYPTPQRLARAQRSSLESIPRLTAEKAEAVQKAAQRSVGSFGGEIAEALMGEALQELDTSLNVQRRLEKLMHQAFDALPQGPHRLLTTIPGIGPATAAAIVAKVVSIERFATPARLVNYFGVFPEENTSGYDKRGNPVAPGTMQMSRQGNDLVRRYLWMAAQSAALYNPAVRTLHARQKARGKRGDVSLGHGMRKLLHLVFAVWKTGRAFDPQHFPWEREPAAAGPAAPEKKQAAGHTEGKPPASKVVTAASFTIKPSSALVNAPQPHPPRRPGIDYAALRKLVGMEQALRQLDWLPRLKQRGRQLRGPCPLHSQAGDRDRSLSVSLDKQIFRCFHPTCSAHGNTLDLWAAVHQLPLYDAAVHLAQTFGLELPLNREEEPVRPPSQPH
jgi:transposase